MTLTVEQAREWFAEDLRVTANLKSPALVRALAALPRERFLGPGPWTIYGTEIGAAPRHTDTDDPRHVYHNVSIAIDAGRGLFNGQPGLIAAWLDALAIAPGERAVHIGCATGYYTALMAEMVGPAGRVYGIEIDDALAARARENLADRPWVDVSQGDGRAGLPDEADVVVVNAGATHVLDEWLDTLRPGGRLLVPLTVAIPGMPGRLSKGLVFLITRGAGGWAARAGGLVVIYSLLGVRDETMNAALGQALRSSGPNVPVTRLRRDAHEREAGCWLHGERVCLGS